MSDSSADRDPLDRLAEEFVARLRAGEHPPVSEYAARLPDRADEVRDLFPALVEMESLKPASGDRTGAFEPGAGGSHPATVGEFRILRQVGQGGMGVVYEALQESLGRHVALKLLPPEAVTDPKRLERFRREAKAAARLHHTNIVPVFGTGTADGRHYYAMQFIAGHPLDAVIDEVRRLKEKSAAAGPVRAVSEVAAALLTNTFAAGESLISVSGVSAPPLRGTTPRNWNVPSPETTCADSGRPPNSLSDGGRGYFGTVARLGAQAADALAYAHAQGVLHRDIKPANLLLDLQGTLWVTDFGLAKSAEADDLTRDGDIVGTLRYMAPERFDGQGDGRADVYALGLTLYELLTLRPAFVADTRVKLVELVTVASPPSPRSVNTAIPRDLETVVLKAIARDPAMRYQSAGELADDLRRFTEDRPIRARRASSAEQAFRWCRRNPAVASLLAAVLLVFAAGAGFSAHFAVRASAERTRAELREQDATDARDRASAKAEELTAEQTRLRAEQTLTRGMLYDSMIVQAATAVRSEHYPHALRLMEETRPKPGEPDLRGWEWHYLRRSMYPAEVGEISVGADRFEYAWKFRPRPTPDLRRVGILLRHGNGFRAEIWDTRERKKVATFPNTGSFLAAHSSYDVHYSCGGLTPDGHYFWMAKTVRTRPPAPKGTAPVTQSVQIWNVETGAELKGHPEPLNRHLAATDDSRQWEQVVVGPQASWISWLEYPAAPYPADAQITVARWERAANAVTRKSLRSEVPMELVVYSLSPDGASLFARPRRLEGVDRLDRTLTHLPHPNPRLECWDLAPATPKPRWPSLPTPGLSHYLQLSKQCRVAAHWDGKEIAVYRLTDGKLAWRMPYARAGFSTVPSSGSPHPSCVSEDGRRVFIRDEQKDSLVMCVDPPDEKGREGVVVNVRESILAPAVGSFWQVEVSADGRTAFTYGENEGILRIHDVSSDPRQTRTPPGDVFDACAEQPAEAGPFGIKPVPWTVRDSQGRQLARFEPANDGKVISCSLLSGNRRLLVTREPPTAPNALRTSAPAEADRDYQNRAWELYATDGPEGLRLLTRGNGRTGTNWTSLGDLKGRLVGNYCESATNRELRLHSQVTGEFVRAIGMPADAELRGFYHTPESGRTAWLTVPIEPRLGAETDAYVLCPPKPLTLHYQAGDVSWTAPVGTGRIVFQLRPVVSKDGSRIAVCFSSPKTDSIEVWVGRTSDGSTVKRIQIPCELAVDPSSWFNRGLPQVRAGLLEFTPDNRLLMVNGQEVQVWDVDAGQPVLRLSGHNGVNRVFLSPDGSRLFVEETGRVTFNTPRKLRVWDLRTNRELLALDLPARRMNGTPLIAKFVPFTAGDGKFYVRSGDSDDIHVFDGTPVKP